MKKFLKYLVAMVVVLTAGGALFLYQQYNQFLVSEVFKQLPVTLEIKKGSSYSDFVSLVQASGADEDELNWKLMAKFNQLENKIKSGEFEITEAFTPRELIEYIDGNNVKSYAVTLVEGLNWQQIKTQLLKNDFGKDLLDFSDEQLIQLLGVEASHLEGQFLPETYHYNKGDSAIDVLRRAHEDLKEALNDAWNDRDSTVTLNTPYELLIMASIIEKETAQNNERNIISGVFHRRLQKGMRLQTDPTVIYGAGEQYAGDITSAHLRQDNPYNTYTRAGLPPTPIAMASEASIIAAAHPNEGKELYFVANRQGGHTFSETYQQHKEAVAAYLRGN